MYTCIYQNIKYKLQQIVRYFCSQPQNNVKIIFFKKLYIFIINIAFKAYHNLWQPVLKNYYYYTAD